MLVQVLALMDFTPRIASPLRTMDISAGASEEPAAAGAGLGGWDAALSEGAVPVRLPGLCAAAAFSRQEVAVGGREP